MYCKEDKDDESDCIWEENDVYGYWFGFQRIGKRMKDLAAVWNRDLFSVFFTLVLSSMNLISCSLIDTNFGFGPWDLVCWNRLLEFLSNILLVIQFLYSIFVIFHNGNWSTLISNLDLGIWYVELAYWSF